MNNYSKQTIDDDDIKIVVEALRSPYLTGGENVELFEENLCQYIGCKYTVVFSSGTAALHGAYSVAGLQKDDEFITTPMTFVATANAGIYLGAKPVFVDIKYNGQINETKIKEKITEKTKLIAPIDFAGNPCEIEEIMKIAKDYNLVVVQDSSHALGSAISGKKIGNFADLTTFSFHPVKPITTFEGGAVTTNNYEYYKKLKAFRSHGITKKRLWNQDMESLGYNYRLSDVACALGISQLKKLDKSIEKRENLAKQYDTIFKEIREFTTIKLPAEHKSSRHLYPILLHSSLFCQKEDIFTELKDLGIGIQVHYKPVNKHSFYKNSHQETFINAEDFYKAEISIPCHQNLSLADGSFIGEKIVEVMKKYKGCAI